MLRLLQKLFSQFVSFPRCGRISRFGSWNLSRFSFAFLLCFLILSSPHASALTAVNTSDTALVKNGLVGHWTFDGKNMTNATATDVSGNGNNGTLTNMTASSGAVVGKIGQGLKFDGSNDYVNAGSASSLDGITIITISAWIKPTTAGGGNYGRIVDKGATLNGFAFYTCADAFIGCSATNNKLAFYRDFSTTAGTWRSSENITLNTWQHVVIIYDSSSSSNDPIFYINSVLATTVEPTTPSGSANSDAANSVLIGNRVALDRAFNGSMDDVRIYNRALTSKEIQALYKAGGGVTQASTANTKANTNATGISGGLIGHWTFDGKNMTRTTALDISGGGNTGTLTNMTASSSVVAGKIGQGLSFNGTSTYINMPSPVVTSYPLTMTGWVKADPLNNFSIPISITDTDSWNMFAISAATSNIGMFTTAVNDAPGDSSVAIPVDATKWTFVAAVFTSATNRVLYVNNLSPVTDTNNRTPVSLDNFNIGRAGGHWTVLGYPNYFGGKLDDVRIYNRVLSVKEIQSLYKAGQVAVGVSPVANVSSGGTGINSGLVGYWTFDGKYMTNATATDSSGNGNNGTLINGPTKVIGKMGQGLKFIGPNAGSPRYVSVPNSSSLNMNGRNTITLASWVKFNSFYSGTCLHNTLIQKGDDNNVGYYGLSVGDTGGCGAATGVRYLDFSFRDSGGTQYVLTATTTDNFKINTWYHVASVCNGTTCTLYRNGVNIGSSAISAAIGSDTDLLSIGEASQNLAGFKYSIDGVQDDVRIYNRALSPAEVKSLYKLGAQ